MADTDCFIFSVCTPLSCLLLQNRRICCSGWGGGGGVGGGGRAELAKFEYFVYDHLKSCRGDDGGGTGEGGLGCLEARFR